MQSVSSQCIVGQFSHTEIRDRELTPFFYRRHHRCDILRLCDYLKLNASIISIVYWSYNQNNIKRIADSKRTELYIYFIDRLLQIAYY